MTVSAAAICRDGDESVLVGLSDRMITSGDVEFESGTSKLFGFDTNWVMGFAAGNTDTNLEIANGLAPGSRHGVRQPSAHAAGQASLRLIPI